MKYEIKWYVDSFVESTYMGSDYFTGTFEDACMYADEHCDGFEWIIEGVE